MGRMQDINVLLKKVVFGSVEDGHLSSHQAEHIYESFLAKGLSKAKSEQDRMRLFLDDFYETWRSRQSLPSSLESVSTNPELSSGARWVRMRDTSQLLEVRMQIAVEVMVSSAAYPPTFGDLTAERVFQETFCEVFEEAMRESLRLSTLRALASAFRRGLEPSRMLSLRLQEYVLKAEFPAQMRCAALKCLSEISEPSFDALISHFASDIDTQASQELLCEALSTGLISYQDIAAVERLPSEVFASACYPLFVQGQNELEDWLNLLNTDVEVNIAQLMPRLKPWSQERLSTAQLIRILEFLGLAFERYQELKLEQWTQDILSLAWVCTTREATELWSHAIVQKHALRLQEVILKILVDPVISSSVASVSRVLDVMLAVMTKAEERTSYLQLMSTVETLQPEMCTKQPPNSEQSVLLIGWLHRALIISDGMLYLQRKTSLPRRRIEELVLQWMHPAANKHRQSREEHLVVSSDAEWVSIPHMLDEINRRRASLREGQFSYETIHIPRPEDWLSVEGSGHLEIRWPHIRVHIMGGPEAGLRYLPRKTKVQHKLLRMYREILREPSVQKQYTYYGFVSERLGTGVHIKPIGNVLRVERTHHIRQEGG